MKKRVEVGWSGWRQITRVLCDKILAAKGKTLQEGSEDQQCCCFGDGGTYQKIGGRTCGGRVKDVEVLFVCHKDGHC